MSGLTSAADPVQLCHPSTLRSILPNWGVENATIGKTVTWLELSHSWTDCIQISEDGTLWPQESCGIVKITKSRIQDGGLRPNF